METHDHELGKKTRDLDRSVGQTGRCAGISEIHKHVCVLVNPGSGVCKCAFSSELLPLTAEEQWGT